MSLVAFRYKLPLVAPIRLKGEWVSRREGILLNRNGAWAEAAPLPGFSRESLEEVIHELRSGDAKTPSLRFALSALDLTDDLSNEDHEFSVPVNALVQGSEQEVREQCRRLVASNCRAVKLKVRDPDRDVELVHRLREALGSDVSLRLDANRAWSYDQAESFMQNVRDSRIEYIEEPLTTPDRLEELFEKTRVPYALDETLGEEDVPTKDFPSAAALIVKPTIVGGLERIQQLVATKKPLVFSASYESGVGIALIARLTKMFSADVPVGLDTYSRLADDVLQDRLRFHDWRLTVPSSLAVRTDMLQLVEL